MAAHDTIIERHVMQTFHTSRNCHTSDKYKQGNHVYLSTQNLTLSKGRARKLVSKFIGPHTVKEAHTVMLPLLSLWDYHQS